MYSKDVPKRLGNLEEKQNKFTASKLSSVVPYQSFELKYKTLTNMALTLFCNPVIKVRSAFASPLLVSKLLKPDPDSFDISENYHLSITEYMSRKGPVSC